MVTTDLSDLGNSAIPHAYAVLGKGDGTVILYHVLELSGIPNPLYAHYSPGKALSLVERESLRQVSAQALEDLVPQGLRNQGTPRSEVRVVEVQGPVYEAICREASALGVDLIVMASHGHSGLTRLFLGSVAEGVLRSTDRPVLIVKASQHCA